MKSLVRIVSRGLAAVCIGLVQLYRWTLSPLKQALLGPAAGCRYKPTCSRYAIDCFKHLPLFEAMWRSAYRILRCNPWGGSGWDPVPGTYAAQRNFFPDEKPVESLKDRLGEKR